MRRIVVAAMSTVTGLVLLFSYHTSTNRSDVAAAVAAPRATASESSGGSSATMASGSFTGDSVDTRWGPVQVQITVKQGKLTNSEAIVYPNANRRDIELNDYALPILADAAVRAQSARIDVVSGATVTSDGYLQSLQSAIDQAFG